MKNVLSNCLKVKKSSRWVDGGTRRSFSPMHSAMVWCLTTSDSKVLAVYQLEPLDC